MFDLDASKILIVGVVALIAVGPKELPHVLRIFGRVVGKMRLIRNTIQNQFDDLMKDADFEATNKELDAIDSSARIDIALNPRTAMRGHLQSATNASETSVTGSALVNAPTEAIYASPEMRDYLAPYSPPQAGTNASTIIEADAKFEAADSPCESARSTLESSAA